MLVAVSVRAQTPAGLALLFEADLKAEGAVKPFVASDDPWGVGFSMRRDLIAQGQGAFHGPRLRGTLDWSKLARKFADQPYLHTLVSGWLLTDDGAEIMYEARGYAVPDAVHAGRWHYTGGLRFELADAPYAWLDGVAAVWTGTFDVSTGTAHYRAYLPESLLPKTP